MLKIICIGFGGFLGAISRYGISKYVQNHINGIMPWGTLVVNLLGCALIGFFITLFQEKILISPETKMFIITGFLGALTTFSTFGYETFLMISEKNITYALGNIFLNVTLGLVAVIFSHKIALILFK